jgi:hypothetical protein
MLPSEGTHSKTPAVAGVFVVRNLPQLCLDDLAALDAAGADAQLLCATFNLGLDGTKVNVPAPLGDVVRVRDVVTELRTFAA